MDQKAKEYKRLKLQELQIIFLMHSRGKSLQEIKVEVPRSRSTISEALNKYKHPKEELWSRMPALEKALYVYHEMQARRRNRKKLGRLKDAEVKSYVYEKLTKEGLTPEEISNEIQVDLPGKKISFKTIYNYTKRSDTSLKAYLVEKGKKRRQRVADRRGRFKQGAPDKRSIHTREEAANNRTELGHWEGDIIVSCRGGSGGVLSLIDRRSREKYYRRVPDLKAEIIYAFMIGFIENNKGRVKTITLDNGSEFAYSVLKKLEKLYPEIKFYYCDSYKSFQKGSVERSNKEIRKYYPKGTDFHGVTQAEIIEIQNKVNNKKMKIHGYLSPVNFRDQDLQTAIAA